MHVLQLCRRAGLLELGHMALDGTKMQANAPNHKLMSYGRIKQESARPEAEVEPVLGQIRKTRGFRRFPPRWPPPRNCGREASAPVHPM